MLQKKSANRFLLPLTALLLLAAVSCADAGTVSEETKAKETLSPKESAALPAETEEGNIPGSPLPENLDFGGRTLRIINNYFVESDRYILEAEESAGDIVCDAIYNRNINTESLLNVKFSFIDYDNNHASPEIKKSVTAGSDDYDLIFGVQYSIAPDVVTNVYMNLEDIDEDENYLNLDKQWWFGNYNKEMAMGEDKTYFVTGDITLGILRNLSCMYVNKGLYTQYFESADEIYQTVLDGKWTLDKLAENCAGVYRDLNGDGQRDDADLYGMAVNTVSHTDHFTYDAGIRATARDKDNAPYLVINNEKTADFTQKLYSIYYDNPGVCIVQPDQEILDVTLPNKLNANELLYMPGWFSTAEKMRALETDFAIIPFPKYDENQETYLALAHDTSTIVCIPGTCRCADAVTAVMEELAFEGWRDILPNYYEVALKVKYVRDSTDAAMRILDIIHDNCTTDFAMIYNYSLGGVGLIERDLMGAKSADFASMYAKKKKNYEKMFTKLMDYYG